jgi:hypothetical protein
MAYIFPSTTQVDNSHLPVGMGDFVVQMPSAARLTETRPNAKTTISNILVVFISFSFQSLSLRTQGTVGTFYGFTARL